MTGQKIENNEESDKTQNLVEDKKSGNDFEIDTDSLYSSFRPDADAGAYIEKLERNPLTAPVVEQVKKKEQQDKDQKKIASEAASLMKSELK